MRLNCTLQPAQLLEVRRILWVIVFTTITSVVSLAQVDRAVLEGTVTDPSGAAIVGARVKARSVGTGLEQEQRTNANGYYRVSGLPLGRYSVTVIKEGFKTRIIEEVTLEVGQTRTLDTQLEVGVVTEKVEVEVSMEPSVRFVSRDEPATTTTSASTASTLAAFRSRPKNRRPGYRFLKTQFRNTVSTPLSTMPSTAPSRAVRLMW